MEEIWKDVVGYEGLYKISNHGIVLSDRGKKRILKQNVSARGYWEVKLCKGGKPSTKTTHRLLALAFIPNENNYPCINHIDGNKLNMELSNLEWCTHEYNMRHAFKNSLIVRRSSQYDKLRRKILDTSNGNVYCQLKDVCTVSGIKFNTLRSYLLGTRRNKSTFRYI